MRLGRRAGRRVGTRKRSGGVERADERVLVSRVDEHACVGRDEFRRPADARRDDAAPARHRFEQRLAEGLDEARLADHVCRSDLLRNAVVGHAADELHAFAPPELRTQRAVADEGQRPLSEAREGVGEAEDVLAPDQRRDAEEARLACRRRRHREAFEVDAGVDHLRLAARLGNLRLEFQPQVVGDCDQRRRVPGNKPCRRAHARVGADVPDVVPWLEGARAAIVPVRIGSGTRLKALEAMAAGRPVAGTTVGLDERGAAGERRDQAGRDEEVRVDHVGAKSPRGPQRRGRQREVLALAAAPAIEDRALDDVTACGERLLEAADEDAEVRVGRPRVHLRDEQDLHARVG